MAKKHKKNNSSRKSNVSIGDKAARQGYGEDPNARPKKGFGSSSMSGMVIGFLMILILVVLVSFQ